jgi:hypothetical protein
MVACSMGGLLLERAMLGHTEVSCRTSHVLLYGAPGGGLVKAGPFRFLKRQVRDMDEKSEFIETLHTQWHNGFEPNVPFPMHDCGR